MAGIIEARLSEKMRKLAKIFNNQAV